jgi:transcription antitermination factor NusG
MFEHNPAHESTSFAERNETVGMSATAPPWYLIRTKSGKEQYVHRELSRRLPETFMPMLETRSRRKNVSLVPLFPQYLFARLELAAHYFEIRYMPGVVGFISTGGELLAVAQTIVDKIRSRCRDGVVQIARPPFLHGQHVRIISGPFREFDAIFEGYLSGTKRVAILIATVEGCGVRVVADAASIAI